MGSTIPAYPTLRCLLHNSLKPPRRRGAAPALSITLSLSSSLCVWHCRTASATTAPCTFRRTLGPTHCASLCTPCQPLVRAFSISSPHLYLYYIYIYTYIYIYIHICILVQSPPPAGSRRGSPDDGVFDSYWSNLTHTGQFFGAAPFQDAWSAPQGYLAHKKLPPPLGMVLL